MNFLAHAYLSFNQPEILAGNMISDFIKGRAKFSYPAAIQRGISLHRAIDDFTDFHLVTQEAKKFFRPAYRLYAGAFIDIVYDHFLANDKNEFPDHQDLFDFSQITYELLDRQHGLLPAPFQQLLPYMKTQNWLYNYRLNQGMRNSFMGLVRRARYLDESEIAYQIFLDNYSALENCYQQFFPSLKRFVMKELNVLFD